MCALIKSKILCEEHVYTDPVIPVQLLRCMPLPQKGVTSRRSDFSFLLPQFSYLIIIPTKVCLFTTTRVENIALFQTKSFTFTSISESVDY